MSEAVTLSSMSIKNFQGIIDAKVQFTGGSVWISGQNASGKSSFLNAVACLFFGVDYAGRMPIRAGEKKAELEGTLSNGLKCRLVINPSGPTLTITDATGLTLGTPRAILNKLIGQLAFDPLRFVTELDEKQQIAQLKTICGLDFTELDTRRAELFARRTDVNREAKSAQAAVDKSAPHDATAPTEEIKTDDLMDELKAARDHNEKINQHLKNIQAGEAALVAVQKEIADLQAKLTAAQAKEAQYTLAIANLKATPLPAEKDVAAIELKLANSGTENAKLRHNQSRNALEAAAEKRKAESERLTSEITAIDETKSKTLTEAKMPIDGLSFSDDYVTYQGKPLSQASTREQMEVSFAICASLNPTLRCVIIPHGSLITPSNRPHFEAIAERYGMQPLVELADESGSVPGIVISEGRIVRADNQPTVEPAKETQKPELSPVVENSPFTA